jgi:uncharacterized protein YoxC
MLEERKKRVKDLYFIEGMTTREIARTERISIRDISAILREEEVKKQNLEDNSQKQLEGRLSANAYRLFDGGMTPVQVAIKLELGEPIASKLYKEYLKLTGLSGVVSLYEKIGDDAWAYLDLYQLGISTGISNKEIVRCVDIALNKLPGAREALYQTKKEENDLFQKKRLLLGDIKFLENKILLLRTDISDLGVKVSRLDEDCEKKTGKIEELRKEEQQIKKLLTNHQKMIFAWILGSALWAMSTVLEKVRKQEEVREVYKGDIAP